MFNAATADDDKRFDQLGTAEEREHHVLGAFQIGAKREPLIGLMLQMIAQRACSITNMTRGVLHCVAHYRAIGAARCEGGHLAVNRQGEPAEYQIDAKRTLRIAVRP